MDVKDVRISEIKMYSRNAKKHDEKQIAAIAKSIEQFGFRQPIVLDKNNEIVIGHGRFQAAKSIGLETVPCEYADDLSDAEIKALRLADNKLNESPWDFQLVDDELAVLQQDLNMADFGFDLEFDLDAETPAKITNTSKEISEDDFDDEQFQCECPRCGFKFNN